MPSDQEFQLYPFGTGEDPTHLECSALMMLAGTRSGKANRTSSHSDAKAAGGPKSMSAMNDALQGRLFTPASHTSFNPHFSNLLQQLFFSGECHVAQVS
jgi:hypothetical protein